MTTGPSSSALRELIDRQPELGVVGLAENGLEAIEQADDLDPDAVVIDLHMPLVDGVTAVARLRRDHPAICLIALTGDDAPKLHAAVKDAGADGVLLRERAGRRPRRAARKRSSGRLIRAMGLRRRFIALTYDRQLAKIEQAGLGNCGKRCWLTRADGCSRSAAVPERTSRSMARTSSR